eukprot:scaffold3476_cov68-Phaeocystis_antarctica.AAC.4
MEADDDTPLSNDAPAARHPAWATASASSRPASTHARPANSARPGASCGKGCAGEASCRAIASARRCVAATPSLHTWVEGIPIWLGPKARARHRPRARHRTRGRGEGLRGLLTSCTIPAVRASAALSVSLPRYMDSARARPAACGSVRE